jgi:hypothetical protein
VAQFSRRDFIQISGLTLGSLGLPIRHGSPVQEQVISIIADPSDQVVSSTPCLWALQELKQALTEQGIKVQQFDSLKQAPHSSLCIAATSNEQLQNALLEKSQAAFSKQPESLELSPFVGDNRHGILAYGDRRGLMYALLDLADRVRQSERPVVLKHSLEQQQVIESPCNPVRSIGRIFCSDIQDKPWFYDRDMWPEYFSMLATHRFNRFSLNFGTGYDFLDNVSDAYFLFPYPFLLPVPGYSVRAVNLPDEERDRNLEMLQFISAQCVAHGIDFQLGIWTHGYKWGPASKPNYTIEGITPDNHVAYSHDALTALLKACPDISGVTLRTHGESGVHEGSYEFWSKIFSALSASERTVKLDLHTKGLNQELIDAALHSGVPLTISPKYWAEHMGLPYHQAAIRELEMPRDSNKEGEFFSLSSGARSFTRYGYADFLHEDRPYKVIYRIWPGSHRLLLWGDPSSAAAHARAFNFCGCDGVELFEPLSLKGRRGSGIAGNRCSYADTSLEPHWDWQKYLYTYRVWGQMMYNPGTTPNTWQRYLRKQFGNAAPAMESALANATAITSIITTAHLPSAANETFNPEYYANQPIVDASRPSPYGDTPAPKVFGNVSPLDPQLFSSSNEFVAELVSKKRSAKYSPLEIAQWLDDKANSAASHLSEAEAHATDKTSPEFRRAAIDLNIQTGIGRFFAAKFRSAILYAVYEQSGDRHALDEAIQQYNHAREIWRNFAENAKGAYLPDITFGTDPHQRGNWLGRLPAIDDDIADMKKRLETAAAATEREKQSSISLRDLMAFTRRESIAMEHTPPGSFVPGQPLEITVSIPQRAARSLVINLYYRHVNQAERYQSAEMRGNEALFTTSIPANYLDSKFPLQYYFELRRGAGNTWLFPGLGSNLQTQPYFVVRPRIVANA